MQKEEILLSKNEYKNNIRELENELDDIFYTLMDNKKNMNAYETQYIACKFENIVLKITYNIDHIKLVDDYEHAKFKKKLKKLLFIIIPNLVLLFFSPAISIGIFLFCIYKAFKYNNELAANYSDDDITFAEFLQSIGTEIQNCMNIIDYITKTRSERAEDKKKSLDARKFDIANDLIQIYLDEEVKNWENIPKNIQELVISILQNDLNTKETDIYNLINIANENLDNLYDKDLTYSMGLIRKLSDK